MSTLRPIPPPPCFAYNAVTLERGVLCRFLPHSSKGDSLNQGWAPSLTAPELGVEVDGSAGPWRRWGYFHTALKLSIWTHSPKKTSNIYTLNVYDVCNTMAPMVNTRILLLHGALWNSGADYTIPHCKRAWNLIYTTQRGQNDNG